MKSDQTVIQQLNAVLKNHLTSMNQYFLHYRMLKNWDLGELAEYEYKVSIKEMKLADKLIERILFLEGLPNLQNLGKLNIGENVPEIIKADFKTETSNLDVTRNAIAVCEEKSDYVSRDLLEETLAFQEDHLDWLEAQDWQIDTMGDQNYVQSAGEFGDD